MSRMLIKRWPDGQYLVSYDPDWQPASEFAVEGVSGVSTWSADPDEAKVFNSYTEAMDCWSQRSSAHPDRPDGQPNRPLTRYSIEVVSAPPIKGGGDDAAPVQRVDL